MWLLPPDPVGLKSLLGILKQPESLPQNNWNCVLTLCPCCPILPHTIFHQKIYEFNKSVQCVGSSVSCMRHWKHDPNRTRPLPSLRTKDGGIKDDKDTILQMSEVYRIGWRDSCCEENHKAFREVRYQVPRKQSSHSDQPDKTLQKDAVNSEWYWCAWSRTTFLWVGRSRFALWRSLSCASVSPSADAPWNMLD